MKRSLSLVLAILVIASFLLAACQPAAEQPAAEQPAAEQPAADTSGNPGGKVVYVVNGVQGDKSFIDSAVRGIRQAQEEFGLDVKIIEAGIDPARWEPALVDAAANEEYDILMFL